MSIDCRVLTIVRELNGSI